jgi:hypothetical protein
MAAGLATSDFVPFRLQAGSHLLGYNLTIHSRGTTIVPIAVPLTQALGSKENNATDSHHLPNSVLGGALLAGLCCFDCSAFG